MKTKGVKCGKLLQLDTRSLSKAVYTIYVAQEKVQQQNIHLPSGNNLFKLFSFSKCFCCTKIKVQLQFTIFFYFCLHFHTITIYVLSEGDMFTAHARVIFMCMYNILQNLCKHNHFCRANPIIKTFSCHKNLQHLAIIASLH